MESPIIEMDMTENSTNQFVNMIEQSEILNVGKFSKKAKNYVFFNHKFLIAKFLLLF